MQGQIITPTLDPILQAAQKQSSMEIRLNSVEDAKAAVQNLNSIVKVFKEGGFDSIEFVIAEELAVDIRAVIIGVFRVKTFYKTIGPRPGNTLFVLPQFREPAPRPVPVRVPSILETIPAVPLRSETKRTAVKA